MTSPPVQYLNPGGPTTHQPPHWLNPGAEAPYRTAAMAGATATRHGRSPWATRADWRAAAIVVGVLAVVGAVLGIVWQAWSPPGPLGLVIEPGAIQPDETEAFVAGDGRFAALALLVGLVAGIAVWLHRSSRGPVVVLALGVGGVLGSYLMALVGHVVRGGSDSGKSGTLLQHVPLELHSHGLLVVEAAVAILGYVICAAFAERDDLSRADGT